MFAQCAQCNQAEMAHSEPRVRGIFPIYSKSDVWDDVTVMRNIHRQGFQCGPIGKRTSGDKNALLLRKNYFLATK